MDSGEILQSSSDSSVDQISLLVLEFEREPTKKLREVINLEYTEANETRLTQMEVVFL